MKLKKILATTVAGLALFAFAGTAAADFPADVNMWGASAQVIMWKNNGAAYMTGQGCTGIQWGETYDTSTGLPDNKNVIFQGTCGGATRYFRISSKASYDAIEALQGLIYFGETAPCSGSNYQRKLLDPSGCNWGTHTCTTTSCYPVTVGATDTNHTCFKQISDGNVNGPAGGSRLVRNFISHPLSWGGAEPCKPLIVPFAFFVSKNVKKGSTTIDNITRDHAEIIFSNQVYDWSDLVDADGNAFAANGIRKCLRHAGSGTHSSLDAYLVSKLIQAQDSDNQVWHNDSSSTMMPCVNMNVAASGYAAIGYADADQDLSLYTNTVRVKLNGVPADGSNAELQKAIKGGNYNFYGLQHLYNAPASLCTFAGGGTISAPWVLESDMKYKRTDTCESFPLELK
ncbi:MAG TPA: hypothetical protein VMT12_11655 [Syntrophales bacterium]|nr:hypothetical protein [Syntrophales bacterium]